MSSRTRLTRYTLNCTGRRQQWQRGLVLLVNGGAGSRREERNWGARGDERDVHAGLHENERDERRIARGRQERATCEKNERETRERTRTRECNVAGCASYIEAQEGSRSEEAEWQVVTRHYRLHTLPVYEMSADRWGHRLEVNLSRKRRMLVRQ